MTGNITFLVVLVATLLSNQLIAQTNVSGGIYSNTAWTAANSPYIVTDTIVVFPGVTLTIEPGVTVKFGNATMLDLRPGARLIADGTSADSITFTSNSSSASPGAYGGISISQSTLPVFRYCNFYYAEYGIIGTAADTLVLNNCNFQFNSNCIMYHTSFNTTEIANCNFTYNINAISLSSVRVVNSIISNNQIGVYYSGNTTLIGCIVNSNDIGVEIYQRDSLYNNEIKFNNTGIKIMESISPVLIAKNIIDSNQIGIENTIDLYSLSFFCNKICNNVLGVKNSTYVNSSFLENNYWCTNDSLMISSYIFDGYDDPSFGLLDFVPFDTTSCYITGCNLILSTTVINATCDTCSNGSASVNVQHGFQPFTYTWGTSPIQVTQTANNLLPGTYTICVTDGHGCTGCSSAYIDSTNCNGFSISAQAVNASCVNCNDGMAYADITGGTAPFSYSWYTSPFQSADTATGLYQGSYVVCITDLYGCVACDTAFVSVGSCSAHFDLYPDTLPHEYLAVNMASGVSPISYSWNWGDGSPVDTGAFPSHAYTTAGFYNICLNITDGSGCTNTHCTSYYLLRQTVSNTIINIRVVSSAPTSIVETFKASELNITPNPTKGEFIINGSMFRGTSCLYIYDIFGKLIMKEDNISNGMKCNLPLSAGLYLLFVTTDNGIMTGKLVVD